LAALERELEAPEIQMSKPGEKKESVQKNEEDELLDLLDN
jgi:hypothetical protein